MNLSDVAHQSSQRAKLLPLLLFCLFAAGCNTDKVDRYAIVVSYDMATGQNNWTAHPEVPRLAIPRFVGSRLHFLAIDECKECDDDLCWWHNDSDLFDTQPVAFDKTNGAVLPGSVNIGHAVANTNETVVVDESFKSLKSQNDFSEETVLSGISGQNETPLWSIAASAVSVQVIITPELTFVMEPLTTRLFAMNNIDGTMAWILEWEADDATSWFLHYLGGAGGESDVIHFLLEKRSHSAEQEDTSLLAIERHSGQIVASISGTTVGEWVGSTGDVVLKSTGSQWVGINGATCMEEWRLTSNQLGNLWYSPESNRFFISSATQLSAVSSGTGEIKWTVTYPENTVMAFSKTKIAIMADADLTLYNVASGQVQWRSGVPSGIHKAKLALNADDNFIVVYGQEYQPAKACGNPF